MALAYQEIWTHRKVNSSNSESVVAQILAPSFRFLTNACQFRFEINFFQVKSIYG